MSLILGTRLMIPAPWADWWPPATLPCSTTASAPSDIASLAAATVPTWTNTFKPHDFPASLMAGMIMKWVLGVSVVKGAYSHIAAGLWSCMMGRRVEMKWVRVPGWKVMNPIPIGSGTSGLFSQHYSSWFQFRAVMLWVVARKERSRSHLREILSYGEWVGFEKGNMRESTEAAGFCDCSGEISICYAIHRGTGYEWWSGLRKSLMQNVLRGCHDWCWLKWQRQDVISLNRCFPTNLLI